MKNVLLIIIALFITHQFIAQDKIIKLTGESISCKVIEITNNVIRYQSIVEDVIRNFKKEKIEKIIFESGDVEEISSRVEIRSEEDWAKVTITNFESDVNGYFRGKEMSAKTSSISVNKSILKKRTFNELKRMAASNGYHMVLIVSQESRDVFKCGRHGGKASAIGVGYSYN